MNPMVKKYIKVSITLGLIAGICALLIGMVNWLTVETIAKNKILKEQNGLKQIYEDGNPEEVQLEKEYQYIEKIWYVKDSQGEELGYVYKTSGKNAYGAISMLVGVEDGNLGQFILLEDTQTFASTLEDNYVSVYNAGEREYSDVSCGATYGAKLIRDMASEALEDYEGRVL